MCGRFGFYDIRLFLELLHQYELPFSEAEGFHFSRSYNIAPESTITVLFQNHGTATLGNARWGVIPHWAKEMPKVQPINARAETLGVKPYFRHMLKENHCLIPANGFYEWKPAATEHKQPCYVRRRDERPMAFAGLWDRWQPPSADAPPVVTCTIITTAANREMLELHDRMPVILEPETWKEWLDASNRENERLLVPSVEGTLAYYAVSTKMNNPMFKEKESIEPIDEGVGGQ